MSYPPQAGLGDMAKATYDPDADGLIAVAQIEMASDKVAVGQGLGSASVEEDNPELPDATPGAANTAIAVLEAPTEHVTASTTYVKVKEVTIPRDGTYRFECEQRCGVNDGSPAWFKMQKNGADFGVESKRGSTTWQLLSQNLAVLKGDVITGWIKSQFGGGYTSYVKNFYVMTDGPVGGSVALD